MLSSVLCSFYAPYVCLIENQSMETPVPLEFRGKCYHTSGHKGNIYHFYVTSGNKNGAAGVISLFTPGI